MLIIFAESNFQKKNLNKNNPQTPFVPRFSILKWKKKNVFEHNDGIKVTSPNALEKTVYFYMLAKDICIWLA